ncbi:MAG: hypothetical protein ABIR10_01090 [Dokdonella sp.]
MKSRPAPLTEIPAARDTVCEPQSQVPAGIVTVAPSGAAVSACCTSAALQVGGFPASGRYASGPATRVSMLVTVSFCMLTAGLLVALVG